MTFAKFFTAISLPKQTQELFILISETCFTFLRGIQMYFFPRLSSNPVLCFTKIIISTRLYQCIRDE